MVSIKKLRSCSTLEAALLVQIIDAGLPEPETEYRFHPVRRWRFDFAWPKNKLAVECEGGTFRRSRHTTGTGFHNDCEKYNTACVMGWSVLRFDSVMIGNGQSLELLREVFLSLAQ